MPLSEIWLHPKQKILHQNYNHKSKNSCGLTHFCPTRVFLKRWGETCLVGTGALKVGCTALGKAMLRGSRIALDCAMRQGHTHWPWTFPPVCHLSAAGGNLPNLGPGVIFPPTACNYHQFLLFCLEEPKLLSIQSGNMDKSKRCHRKRVKHF